MNLVWFRNDLRIKDNPALHHAMSDNDNPTLGIYLLCLAQWKKYGIGANQQALFLKALENLQNSLKKLNVQLLVIDAKNFKSSPEILKKICKGLSARKLYFNIEYPVDERTRDKKVVNLLKSQVECHRFHADSLTPPWKITNQDGSGYKVFTAYANRVRKFLDEHPVFTLPVPQKKNTDNLHFILNAVKPEQLGKFKLIDEFKLINKLPDIKFTAKALPEIKETYLSKQLAGFCESSMQDYKILRDFPAQQATSALSTGLAIGCISVAECYQQAIQYKQSSSWINELIWRDFYRSVMWHYPHVCKGKTFKTIEDSLDWSNSKKDFEKWKSGNTGIPIIDAAMQQLVQTGWMHNRLRMVVASYLTKNLWLNWRCGEAFFADQLFDYDFASNNGGWQWCASTGTDAAPYFRVFNPASQQKKFDPDAKFIKQWLPQLKAYSAKQIHNFESKPLGDYYALQVDLKQSRKLAIEKFKLAG